VGRDIQTAIGAVLMAIAVALAVIHDSGHSVGYEIGRAFGAVLVGVVVVAVARLVWTRALKHEGKVWTPTAVLVAGALALLGTVSALGQETRDREKDRAQFVSDADACRAQQPEPVSPAPAGYELQPFGRAGNGLLDQMSAALGIRTGVMSGHQVLRAGRPAGVVMFIPGTTGAKAADVEDGFRDAATESRMTVSNLDVEGNHALVASGGPAYELVSTSGCYAFVVAAQEASVAQDIAGAVVRAGPDR
jgi:hypothetical protein